MAGGSRLASSLEKTLSSTIVPYGYTVTVWICGAYLVRKQGAGTPGVGLGEGVAFAAGLHVLAIGLAVGSSMLASRWLGSAAWFAAPFLATGVYLAVASVELAFALELSRRESRFAHGVRMRRAAGETAAAREAVGGRDEVKAGHPGP